MSTPTTSSQDANYRYFADLAAQLPEIIEDTIVSRTLYDGEQVRAILFGFAPGQELSEHTAAKRALLYFISGEADLMLGGEAHRAHAGTFVEMSPHLAHSVSAETEVVMLLLLLE
jgi:quercetin dioxygenase-like cupin family protein